MEIVTQIELTILIRIILAHMLADFFLQPYSWIKGKRRYRLRSRHLYLHVAVVGIVTYVLVADWTAWKLPLFIVVTHFLIDWWKSGQNSRTRFFVYDQIAHLLVILAGWAWYIGVTGSQFNSLLTLLNKPSVWIILASYLVVLRPAGFLIQKVTAGWRVELSEGDTRITGLKNAGTWIGYMERLIILTFILLSQYSAIGFLIAAKSVFRFSGGVQDTKERKLAEYIIIGTLISFSVAILIGIGAVGLLGV